MREVRCPQCNRLLFRTEGDIDHIEIKCTCRRIVVVRGERVESKAA